MTPYFKIQNSAWLLFLALITTSVCVAQRDVEKWKLKVALGVNNTIDQEENVGYFSKQINFPTINLGVEHMFTRNFGAKFDLGYNRSSEAENSLPYKLNYTRLNVQAVYDFKDLITFLPRKISVVAHAGPGFSMTKPLSNFGNNTNNFVNVLGGLEVHYRLTESLSIYADGSYVYSLSNKNEYEVNRDGFSFNGDLAYVAFGVSISLSGYNYCY